MHTIHNRTPQRFLPPDLAASIRKAKTDSGLSWRQLGAEVERSHSFLVQIAGGKRVPGRLTAQRLIDSLGLDPEIAEELLRLAPPPWWEQADSGRHRVRVDRLATKGVAEIDRVPVG